MATVVPTRTIDTVPNHGALDDADLFLIQQSGSTKHISLADLTAAIIAVLPSILSDNNVWTGTNDFTNDTTFDDPALFNDSAQFAGSFNSNDTSLGVWLGLISSSAPRIAWADGSGSNYQVDVASSTMRFIKGGAVFFTMDYPNNFISFGMNLSVGTTAAAPYSDTRVFVRGGVAGASNAIHPTEVVDSQYVFGGAAAGFGGSYVMAGTDSTTDTVLMGELQWRWRVATHATRQADIHLTAHDFNTTVNNPRIGVTVSGDGTQPLVGFYGAPAVAQPAAVPAPVGGVVIDIQARAAIALLINLLSAAVGGNGLTA